MTSQNQKPSWKDLEARSEGIRIFLQIAGNQRRKKMIKKGYAKPDDNNINMEAYPVEKSKPGIQCVSRYLRGIMGFESFYTPQIISFGPIHFNEQRVGDSSKSWWTATFLEGTNQNYVHVVHRIDILWDQLWQSYLYNDMIERDSEYSSRKSFKWIWMEDGCSILHVLDRSCNSNDPENALHVSFEHLVRVHKDMLLLENQVPFILLKILCNNDEAKLNACLQNFLKIHGVSVTIKLNLVMDIEEIRLPYMQIEETSTSTARQVSKNHSIVKIGDEKDEDKDKDKEDEPIHLLDYLHRALLMKSDDGKLRLNKKSLYLRKYRVASIQELKKAGIQIQKHPNDDFFQPVFDSNRGILQLPKLTLNDLTVVMYLNLIAYEMCPNFRNNFGISSYIVFFSSLVEKPEDVKELRSCGVLINELAGDKEVVDLFNRLDALLVPETNIYAEITNQMQKYFVLNPTKIKMLGWLEEAYSSFLHSPWTVIALLAATLGLTLTFIQTWFAIHPKDP